MWTSGMDVMLYGRNGQWYVRHPNRFKQVLGQRNIHYVDRAESSKPVVVA